MTGRTIEILGAGIAGLATALALARMGFRVVVHEQAAAFSEIGAGLQLGPNAVRALRRLGAWEAIEPFTRAPASIEIRDGVSGQQLRSITLSSRFEQRYSEPYRVILRADLHAALLRCVEALPNIIVKMNSLSVRSTHPLIAADGVRSPTREKLFGQTPIRNKATFFRALGPVALDDRVSLVLYPGAHVVAYAVGDRMNMIVAVDGVERDGSVLASEVAGHLHGSDSIRNLIADTGNWSCWPAYSAPRLATWHHNRVCLIGDAAHGCLPYLAQGAAMALEDAVAMGEAFRNREARDAFMVFEQNRKKRTDRVARASLTQGRTYHAKGPLRVVRNQVLRHLPDAMLDQRLDWIYAYNQ